MVDILVYGATYAIKNGYQSFTGGFLDTRGAGCEGNKLCVSTAISRDRDKGSGTWRILSASGACEGTPVRYGDTIYLFNLWNGDGGYLDTRNRGCEGNYLCVSTATTSNRDDGSGSWRILSADGVPSGRPVLTNEAVHLFNLWSGDGGYLDTRNRGCEGNLLCVSTSTSSNRDSGSGSWKFLEQEV